MLRVALRGARMRVAGKRHCFLTRDGNLTNLFGRRKALENPWVNLWVKLGVIWRDSVASTA